MALDLGFVTQTTMHYGDALPAAAAMNLDYVELMLDGHHERTRLDTETVGDLAVDNGLDLAVHLPFALDIGSPSPHVREGAIEELTACLETAGDLDARVAVVHADSDAWRPAWDTETVKAHILDSLGTLQGVAADQGVRLCVENIPGEWFGLEDFETLFAETECAMTFDTGHAYIEGYDSAAQRAFVADHADRIDHVHVNDTRRQSDEHVPVGSGVLDFGRILSPLETATLSLEVFTPSYEYVGLSANTLRREVDGLASQ